MSYTDLLPPTSQMTVAEDLFVRVLDLATLIEIKEQLGTEKDIAALPLLRRTLLERKL